VWLFILGAKKKIVSLRLYFHGPMPFPTLSFVIICGCMEKLSNPSSIEQFAGLSRLGSLAEKLFPFQEGAAPPRRFQVDWRLEKKRGFLSQWGTPKSSMLGFSLINHPFWVPHLWKLPYQIFTKKNRRNCDCSSLSSFKWSSLRFPDLGTSPRMCSSRIGLLSLLFG